EVAGVAAVAGAGERGDLAGGCDLVDAAALVVGEVEDAGRRRARDAGGPDDVGVGGVAGDVGGLRRVHRVDDGEQRAGGGRGGGRGELGGAQRAVQIGDAGLEVIGAG